MTNKPSNQNQGRSPKYVWVVRPSFSAGLCRTYFSKEAALRDYGQPPGAWHTSGSTSQIAIGPVWDPDNCTWELERVEVRG